MWIQRESIISIEDNHILTVYVFVSFQQLQRNQSNDECLLEVTTKENMTKKVKFLTMTS